MVDYKKEQASPVLSILICTIHERKNDYNNLLLFLKKQIADMEYPPETVEILSVCDNKELTIGAKRQQLLEMSTGKFIVFVDDDDLPSASYIIDILGAIHKDPSIDCIGMTLIMTTNGSDPLQCLHSIEVPEWRDGRPDEPYSYYRNINHFNPVLREHALKAGFDTTMRYGEDHDYSKRLNKYVTKQYFIEKTLLYYRYSNDIEHDKKYGIK